LHDELTELRQREVELGAEAAETAERVLSETVAQATAAARAQLELERGRADIKTNWWQTRLGKESIAAIVGGLLLLALTTTLIVAVFTSVSVSEVITNAFLILLGSFFGSTTAQRGSSPGCRWLGSTTGLFARGSVVVCRRTGRSWSGSSPR
jgi:hypothetical protein